MRDPETGKGGSVPADMTYQEWKEIYVDKTSTMEEWEVKHVDKTGESGIIKAEDNKTPYAEAGLMFLSKRDDLYRFAQKVPPIDGYEDITLHADRESFLILDPETGEKDKSLSAKELAALIKNSGHYKNTPIRLLSCQAGYGEENSLAQQLSDELGVNVIAPNEILAIDTFGQMFISDNHILIDMWSSGIKVKETGKWIEFIPRR